MQRFNGGFVLQYAGIIPVLAAVLCAAPSQTSSDLKGAIDCNSQEERVDYKCNGCKDTIKKCNQAMGDKTKLCNVDAGNACDPDTCSDTTKGDHLSNTACTAVYN